MVEIFDTRIEITNPGAPLVDTQRFLGSPPRSRNETLASMMRRIGICEERGSGIEKAMTQSRQWKQSCRYPRRCSCNLTPGVGHAGVVD